jgi:hypothetical protein
MGICCAAAQQACSTAGGRTCCDGTSCCASSCQIGHDNGLGQRYFDCGALGAYSHTTAQLAADAWSPTGGADSDSGTCLSRQTTTECATWCYAGPFAGRVNLNVLSVVCLSPTALSSSWY